MSFYLKPEYAGTAYRACRPILENAYPRKSLQERGHRSYSPSQGRWLSRDPIGEIDGDAKRDSVHLYKAFLNNAVSLSDPVGLCTWSRLLETRYTPGGTAACLKRVAKTIWITPCFGCPSYPVTIWVTEIGWMTCDLIEACLCPPDWTVVATANCGPCH